MADKRRNLQQNNYFNITLLLKLNDKFHHFYITASRTTMSSMPIVKPRNWRKQVKSRARLDRSLPAMEPPYNCKSITN